jgi:hypothetical protein
MFVAGRSTCIDELCNDAISFSICRSIVQSTSNGRLFLFGETEIEAFGDYYDFVVPVRGFYFVCVMQEVTNATKETC